jgi:hypothetical protein
MGVIIVSARYEDAGTIVHINEEAKRILELSSTAVVGDDI